MLTPPAVDPVSTLAFFLIVFTAVGVFFLFIHLVMGSVIRPSVPDPEKLTIYECGEPTVGSAWVQFDLRYYVVALLFVIFDVEVAFFFPWAMVFGKANQIANLPEPPRTVEARQQYLTTDQGKQHLKLSEQLLPTGMKRKTKEDLGLATYRVVNLKEEATVTLISPNAAKGWAQVAFLDILVFFGVLMVGFAYVWRRGDINWIKTVTHRGGEHPLGESPPQAAA